MYSIQNLITAVNSQVEEFNTRSEKLKEQANSISAVCLELVPPDLDSTVVYNFCLVYNILTTHGFKFAGYCPSVSDLQWVVYRNQTDQYRPCLGRLLYRQGLWKTDGTAGNFNGQCNLEELVKSSNVVFL